MSYPLWVRAINKKSIDRLMSRCVIREKFMLWATMMLSYRPSRGNSSFDKGHIRAMESGNSSFELHSIIMVPDDCRVRFMFQSKT